MSVQVIRSILRTVGALLIGLGAGSAPAGDPAAYLMIFIGFLVFLGKDFFEGNKKK